jgi:hypothetical protein
MSPISSSRFVALAERLQPSLSTVTGSRPAMLSAMKTLRGIRTTRVMKVTTKRYVSLEHLLPETAESDEEAIELAREELANMDETDFKHLDFSVVDVVEE